MLPQARGAFNALEGLAPRAGAGCTASFSASIRSCVVAPSGGVASAPPDAAEVPLAESTSIGFPRHSQEAPGRARIGAPYTTHMTGPVADPQGNLYAVGFSNGPNHQPPDVFIGDSYLYRINKNTGAATRVGDTGIRDLMDLSFDSMGRLYATTMNQLYLINRQTGAARKVADITGVPANACGIPLEIMSIEFDAQGVLYATAIEGFAQTCFDNTAFLKIDPKTGVATVVGWTGQWYNHGGAIYAPRLPG